MAGSWRRPAGRVRPGLTLIELLVGIGLLGVAGAVLMPRLASTPPAGPCTIQQDGFIGIGARLDLDLTDDGYVRVDRPLIDTPAERMGLETDDVILRVDEVSVQNEGIDTVRHRIMNGAIGSPVELTVRRDGEPLELTICRAWIAVPAQMRCNTGDWIGAP